LSDVGAVLDAQRTLLEFDSVLQQSGLLRAGRHFAGEAARFAR
jgi:hypothetical protein